jgi:hypothetical protein
MNEFDFAKEESIDYRLVDKTAAHEQHPHSVFCVRARLTMLSLPFAKGLESEMP